MLRRLAPIIAAMAALALAQASVAATSTPPAPADTFASPQDAAAALYKAAKANNLAEMAHILGPGSENLLQSGDPTQNANENKRFVEAYEAKHQVTVGPGGQAVLVVGDNDWPLPIPIVGSGSAWHFDSHQGAQDIIDRRIGRNEIAAIRVCLTYDDAQHAYFDLFKQATGAGAYAQRLVSTPGNYDGLYWPAVPGIPDSPFQPLIASAMSEGYPGELVAGRPAPYEGYYFKVLKAQGPDAPGGAHSYIVNNKMTGGFALLAWPARFGATGVMSFIIGPDGVVFQKDLGPETARRAADITTFNPDLSWTRVDITG